MPRNGTEPPRTPPPNYRGPVETPDVIVIGGGIAGASVAYELAAHRSVLLLEGESSLAMHSTGRSAATYIPGHGAVARDADFDRYVAMLGAVEEAARKAQKAGTPAAEAANSFALPPSLGEWTVFAKPFFERAFAAWYKELGA